MSEKKSTKIPLNLMWAATQEWPKLANGRDLHLHQAFLIGVAFAHGWMKSDTQIVKEGGKSARFPLMDLSDISFEKIGKQNAVEE